MQNRLMWDALTDDQLSKLKLPSSQDAVIWELLCNKIRGNVLTASQLSKIKFNESNYFILQGKKNKKFLLGRLLGKGAYGVVYVAVDIDSLEMRAIKIMPSKDMPCYNLDNIFRINYLSYDCKSVDLVGLEKFADTSGINYICSDNISDELVSQNLEKDNDPFATYSIIDAPYLPGNTLNKYFLMPLHFLRNNIAKDLSLSVDQFKCNHKKDRFSDMELLLLARNLLLEIERFHRNNFVMVDVRDNNFILNPKELTIKACDFGGIALQNLAGGMSPNNIYLDDPNKLIDDLFINKKFNVYSIGVIIGIMFEYIELINLKNVSNIENFLLEQRYQFNPENIQEFIRNPLIELIQKMLNPNKEIRPSISQCIDMMTQIIISFCKCHPEYIKTNKSSDVVLWRHLNEFIPNGKNKSTSNSIIAMIAPLYKNWETKSQNDRKIASAETKKIIVHELSNCNPKDRVKIALELRDNPIFGKHVNHGIAALGRTDRQIILDSYIHSSSPPLPFFDKVKLVDELPTKGTARYNYYQKIGKLN